MIIKIANDQIALRMIKLKWGEWRSDRCLNSNGGDADEPNITGADTMPVLHK